MPLKIGGYTFDLSGLESDEFAELFVEAGQHYWGVGNRNDNSHNKAYFGETRRNPETGLRRRAELHKKWKYALDLDSGELVRRKIYTYTVIFNKNKNWVNCDVEGEIGADFFNTSGHEWGHMVRKDGWHSDNPNNIMHNPSPYRCSP